MISVEKELENWKMLWKTYESPEDLEATDEELTAIYEELGEESGVTEEDDYDEAEFIWADNVHMIENALGAGISKEEIVGLIPDAGKYFEENEIEMVQV